MTADKIAANLGVFKRLSLADPGRDSYVLNELTGDGHVYYPYPLLIEKCAEILAVKADLVAAELARVAAEKHIVLESEDDVRPGTCDSGCAVYLSRNHYCETGISYMLKRLMATPKLIRPVDAGKAAEWVQDQLHFTLAENQKRAVVSAIQNKFMVITGGPGTGKTTIIQAVLKIYRKLHANILLAAPTGRAAKQMSETTGFPAKTIHRMLSLIFIPADFRKMKKTLWIVIS